MPLATTIANINDVEGEAKKKENIGSDNILKSKEGGKDLVQHEEATKHGEVKDNIEIKVPDKSFMDRKVDSVKGL